MQKLFFRFAFFYLVLYSFPSPLDYIRAFERVAVAYFRMWNPLVLSRRAGAPASSFSTGW